MKISVLTVLLFLLCSTQAQISGTNVWAKGNYIEMGMNNYGVYTAHGIPPAGFVGADTATAAFTRSFIVDKDQDGWSSGSPAYWGDYCAPGGAEEGFGFRLNDLNYYNFDQYLAPDNMDGFITKYEEDADSINISWDGELPGVSYSISQETMVAKNGLYVITRLIFVNISFDYFYNAYYFRNIDPDQEQMFNGNVNTVNAIISNFPADAKALVKAEGSVAGDNFCLVGSRDTRSRVSFGSFDMATAAPSPADVWNGIAPFTQTGSLISNDALQIAVKFDTLLPCSAESFTFAYIFTDDSAVIEEALALTERPTYGALCVAADTFSISDLSSTSFTVTWAEDDNMDFVLKYMDMATGATYPVPTDLSTIAIAGLEPCKEYGVNLFSVCGGDTLPADPDYTIVKTVCIDGVEDAADHFDFSIYPNPATDHFTVVLPEGLGHGVTIIIRDITGKAVYEQSGGFDADNRETIRLPAVAKGIYTITVWDDRGGSAQKMMVIE